MDGMERLNVEIKGVVGLIMHDGKLANPLDEHSRAIRELMDAHPGVKNKTEKFYSDLAFLEFRGGIYYMNGGKNSKTLVPCIPSRVLMANIRQGAKKFKKDKTHARVGIIVLDPVGYPLIYDGPTDAREMFDHGNGKTFVDQRMMKVNRAPILRTRAIFRQWSLKYQLEFDPSILNRKTVVEFIEAAGRFAGLGDSWPEHGRYELVSAK